MMKRLLIFLIFLFSVTTYGQLSLINVGTNPNDHTGDPLRPAFIKTNSAITQVNTNTGNILLKANSASPTFTGTVTLPTSYVIGTVLITATGSQINYLDIATGRTGTGNIVFSISPTFTGTVVGITSAMTGSVATADSATMLIPYIERKDTSSMLASYINRVDTAAMLGNYLHKHDTATMLSPYSQITEVSAQIGDTVTAQMAAALPGAAARDSTGTIDALGVEKWVTKHYLESYVGSGGGGAFTGDIVRFIVGVTTGAPIVGDSAFTHSLFPGKDVDLIRSGALNWNNGDIALNTSSDSYRLNSNTITASPPWQDREKVEFRIREPGTWSYVAIEGEESTLLDSLKSYWKMDDVSGDLVDFLGYRNLWLPPGVSPTPRKEGKIGYSWLYNPVTDDYHTRYDTTSFNFKDAFSVSAWIKSSAANSDGSIVGKADGGPPTNGWTLEVHAGNATAEMWKNGVEKAVTSATDVSDTNWHHLVMTWDGTLTLYVDGASEGTPLAAPYGFGTYSLFKVTRTLAAWFDGYIDNIGFWHKELSAAEVTELFDKEDVGNEYPWP